MTRCHCKELIYLDSILLAREICTFVPRLCNRTPLVPSGNIISISFTLKSMSQYLIWMSNQGRPNRPSHQFDINSLSLSFFTKSPDCVPCRHTCQWFQVYLINGSDLLSYVGFTHPYNKPVTLSFSMQPPLLNMEQIEFRQMLIF